MIICEVNKNNLNVRTRELLTSGSRRVNTVEFRFNSDWIGLSKTATFRTKKKTVSVRLDDTNICMIPWEVLSDAEESLAVGVFGVDGETLILPTVWGILGKVADAAEMGDSEKEPTPNVYQQILDELNSLENPTWENVGDKPFEKIGDGLSVENGVLSSNSAVSEADIQKAVNKYLTEHPVSVGIASKESPGIVAVGENLKISETGALSVDTTDVAEEDNTKPITSSGVNTIVGNIGAILETI